MTDAAEARARVIAGTDVHYATSSTFTRFAWADQGELVLVEIRDGKVFGARAESYTDPKRDPFDAMYGGWTDQLYAPAAVPDDRFARVRALRAAAVARLAGVCAGAGWFPLDEDFILHDEALGYVRVFGGKEPFARVRSRRQLEDELYQRLWADGPEHVALVASPPGALAEIAQAFIAAMRTRLAQIDAGTHAFSSGRPIVAFDGRYVEVGYDPESLANIVFNPYGYLFSREELVVVLSDNFERAYVVPLTPEMSAALPAIREALKQTRAQVVEHYVAEIRAGKRTISGGLSDSPWTVRSPDGVAFTISGYDDNGPKEDPLTEQALRDMLTSFRAYGLAEP